MKYNNTEVLDQFKSINTNTHANFNISPAFIKEPKNLNVLQEILAGSIKVGTTLKSTDYRCLIHTSGHDREMAGGCPDTTFLFATAIKPGVDMDIEDMDSSLILLRVTGEGPLPDDQKILEIIAQRAIEKSAHGHKKNMDPFTSNFISNSGLSCKVLRTYYLEKDNSGQTILLSGGDNPNFYPNRSMVVYKPTGRALEKLLYINNSADTSFSIGKVRYSSTNRILPSNIDADVRINILDIINQRTALFGHSRYGKSNTLKQIIKSVYDYVLRNSKNSKVGQVIFDPDGEYANDNVQDASDGPSSIRNVYKDNKLGSKSDVVTFGTTTHVNDPDRRLLKIDFYNPDYMEITKEILNDHLREKNSSVKYINNYIATVVTPGDSNAPFSTRTRCNRHVLVQQILLYEAGFPTNRQTLRLAGLFGDGLRKALIKHSIATGDNQYSIAAEVFSCEFGPPAKIAPALKTVRYFITDGNSTYLEFNRGYMSEREHKGEEVEGWHDANLLNLLEMLAVKNGPRLIGRCSRLHNPDSNYDYREEIYKAAISGKVVIIDQSTGSEKENKLAADRIAKYIFKANSSVFSRGVEPPPILLYIEEAHNSLPAGDKQDSENTWIQVAKQGSKFAVGMVYSTQEITAIHKSILSQTDNFFVSYINNKNELRVLSDYLDFEDFIPSIAISQDVGFSRIRTRSMPFTVPTQIDKYVVQNTSSNLKGNKNA
jgi:hypothetical protein